MHVVSILLAATALVANVHAGKGHPVGYNYCSVGLTRPKQPKPLGYQPPPKPIGQDFPIGKPAALPSSAGFIKRPLVKPVTPLNPVTQPPEKKPDPTVEPTPVTQPEPGTQLPSEPAHPIVKPAPVTTTPPVTDPSQDPTKKKKEKKPKKPKKEKKAKKPKQDKVCDHETGKNCANSPPETRSVSDPVHSPPKNCTATKSTNGTHPWTPKHKHDRSNLSPVSPIVPTPKKHKVCKKKPKNVPEHGNPGHADGKGGHENDKFNHEAHHGTGMSTKPIEPSHHNQVPVYATTPPAIQTHPSQSSGSSHPWPGKKHAEADPAPEHSHKHHGHKHPKSGRKAGLHKDKQPPVMPPVEAPIFNNHTKSCNITRSKTRPVLPPKHSGSGTSGLSPIPHDNDIVPVPGGLVGEGTTTQYSDAGGACNCPSGSGVADWQYGLPTKLGTFYSFAGSEALFQNPSLWCGAGCGKCFKLTSLGNAPEMQGTGAPVGDHIFAVLTNACPLGDGKWCPKTGDKNPFGSSYHFDILSRTGTFNGVRWDNPRVHFEQIECPSEVTLQTQTCVCKA